MSRSLLLRLLENFFRRWYLYLVPVVLLGLFGIFSLAGSKKQFQSVGTFNVESSTVLSSLSGTNDPTYGFDTPATSTSKRIAALLQTEQFVKEVAAKAKLDAAVAAGQITIEKIRSSIQASPNGANLVNVVAKSEIPAVAQALAGSTIDAFVQDIVDSQASQSDAAVTFFDGLLPGYKADVDKARQAVDAYTSSHPAPVVGNRSDDEQAELGRLNTDLSQAQSRYDDALSKKQDAQLSTEKTRADVGERLRIVDAPALPQAPLGSMSKLITSFGTFIVLGCILSVAAVVLGTLLDHTIRTPSDVSQMGYRLLTVVPDAGGRQPKKAPAAKPAKSKKEKTEARPAGGSKPATRPATPRVAGSAAPRTGATPGRRQSPRPVGKAAGGSSWPG